MWCVDGNVAVVRHDVIVGDSKSIPRILLDRTPCIECMSDMVGDAGVGILAVTDLISGPLAAVHYDSINCDSKSHCRIMVDRVLGAVVVTAIVGDAGWNLNSVTCSDGWTHASHCDDIIVGAWAVMVVSVVGLRMIGVVVGGSDEVSAMAGLAL